MCIYIYIYTHCWTLLCCAFAAADPAPQSMNSLLLAVLCGPEAELMYKLLAAGWPCLGLKAQEGAPQGNRQGNIIAQ